MNGRLKKGECIVWRGHGRGGGKRGVKTYEQHDEERYKGFGRRESGQERKENCGVSRTNGKTRWINEGM